MLKWFCFTPIMYLMKEHQKIDHTIWCGQDKRWKPWDSICALFFRMGVKTSSRLINRCPGHLRRQCCPHYSDVIMYPMVSKITSVTIVYSIVYSGADQIKHQSSASLAFVRGIHRWPVNSPHKWPVTRKMSPFDDVIMLHRITHNAENFHTLI